VQRGGRASRLCVLRTASALALVTALVTLALTPASSSAALLVAGQAAPVPPRPRPAPAPPLPAPALSAPALPAKPLLPLEQLQQDILAITRGPGVERGVWGIVVQSLDRPERLFELNPRTLLVPASVAKILPVATAVDEVGWTFRFETALKTNGMVTDGTLNGDLFIVGSGDPSISGRAGDDLSGWISALIALHIRQINGRVIGDDDALEDPRPAFSWAWDDLGTSGALYGALNLEENRMQVTVTPGAQPGAPVEIAVDPAAMSRPLANRAVTAERGAGLGLWTEQRPGELELTVAGSLPVGAAPARLAVAVGNPTLWFARVLRHRLIEAGISISGEAYDVDDVLTPERSDLQTLYTARSRPLSDIVQPLLKDSINVYGEALLRLNAPRATPTNELAVARVGQKLTAWGIPADGQQIVDGSGLSRRDVMAAETLTMVLQKMHDADPGSPWMNALPIAGVDGTLASRMRGTPAANNVRAKTGSMSNIRSLAGYVTTRDGEHLAFAIMVNNFEGAGATALQAIDAIAVRLASFQRSGCCSK
jgi:D-alanyl-D-alanine carboxypeptidase/D-alanyl-D-alanine-endopeptidase (penicillin-binding protein 4)